MKAFVEEFPKQLLNALNTKPKHGFDNNFKPSAVLVAGMGGSGICGTIFTDVFRSDLTLPVFILKDYEMPAWVNATTLVIACSYSGNTEETLAVVDQAINRGARIICISSGGQLSERSHKHSFPLYTMPGGQPPRASIAYPFVYLCDIFFRLHILPDSAASIESLAHFLTQEQSALQLKAQEIAQQCFNKLIVVYGFGSNEGVCIRCRQQLNENSKVLCWHHMFPEMNHNELVGWVKTPAETVVLGLHTDFDAEQNKKRYRYCKPIFNQAGAETIDIQAKGSTLLEQSFYLIVFSDWLSCYLADLKGIDATEVRVIDGLKAFLST